MPRQLSQAVEIFPLKSAFAISRGAKSAAEVIVATITDGAYRGRGECVPYARYGESLASVAAQIETARSAIEAGADRAALQSLLPAGAARNALDCALWDFEAKRLGIKAQEMAGLHRLPPCVTAYTLSLGTPDDMGKAAKQAEERPLLKIKLGGGDGQDAARLAAVRKAAPESDIIVDANEGWAEAELEQLLEACAKANVVMVEQPLPAGKDAILARIKHIVPLCADESIHDRHGLAELRERYDLVNIKLDKTGGLTEALALAKEAEQLGFGLFIGCMIGSSLAMAPALLLTPRARFVDLDGPLLLAQDRAEGLRIDGSIIHAAEPALWG